MSPPGRPKGKFPLGGTARSAKGAPISEPAVHPGFAASHAVVDWCLRNARRMEQLGAGEQAALFAYVAAGTAARFGHAFLCSAPIETLLSRVGHGIASPGPAPPARHGSRLARWLHVFTLTAAIGGHTAIARRWIRRNPFGEQHSVALTVQPAAAVDASLAAAVHRTGGAVHSLAEAGTLFARAAALRALAWAHADVVVLHVSEWDVTPALAFAVPGGPPVLLMNHADHAFWIGCANADLVVDIRDSGLGLSQSLRGARASAVLPVPLEDHGAAAHDRAPAAARLRDASCLGRGPVLVTIGSAHKYRSLAPLDFFATIDRIVRELGECTVIAVGADPTQAAWQDAAVRSGGRIVAVGPDPDLAAWHAVADLYLEGFPIGSYTALLEVALAARAFVRKPWLAPPSELAIDRGALAAFDPPPDPHAYARAAVAMAGDPAGRVAMAVAAREAILNLHCGERWDARLRTLQEVIPAEHHTGFGAAPRPMPAGLATYRAALLADDDPGAALGFAQRSAVEQGLRPRVDVVLVDALRGLA